ncbi:NUDIX domain-containing protein [Amycolatopsis rubida]|uniref:NUDIX domain-containing protein n=1 Tax=Amycolatopsis rubida TaxID=112413 RepID=A0ABX0BR09_9PSEU|nr:MULTISPECIES: NUDIX domain-containing protein [Amycolatopsis]MYW92366.1 NUDIX domain-containing protein [Amycolatopsis rubida]MYW95107.1 NUDIX domain-containing protein [Amycolatopsis rubida]NEC57354.1 NUDIX domain-containing protein [Amycolatopsis rubida]NEC60094.1 NUDIX domain-containing protein [Amycolatopsis rubida]OAP24979.1 RNA pyrophosphohydrolase [Amycolatopsis sp. M39]
MPAFTSTVAPRIGARVLLLDRADRVLLIHALDPTDPEHHWWELPGGGLDEGEDLRAAACRELAEESGITLTALDRELWIRESRFRYKNRDHHRIEHVFLGRAQTTAPQVALKPTENEKAGLIERRWWTADELRQCRDKLLPATLPVLLDDLLADRFSPTPLALAD